MISSALNGAGDVWTPMLINVISFWLFGVSLAELLARPIGLGPSGVFVAMTVSFVMMAISAAALFRRGRWKLKRV